MRPTFFQRKEDRVVRFLGIEEFPAHNVHIRCGFQKGNKSHGYKIVKINDLVFILELH